jgi:hypothetical protein
MGYINKIIIIGLIILSSNKNQAQGINNSSDYIYGKWKVEKELSKQYTKFGTNDVGKIKESILHIEKNKIYFENINFVDTCFFTKSKIRVSELFDKKNDEYYWFEEGDKLLLPLKYTGPLPTIYTKKQLKEIYLIDLGCGYDLSILYLKQDTLILNYLGGVTFFLTKLSNEVKEYKGNGNSTKELLLTGKETSIKLDYEFYKEPDQLILEDQNGKQLFKTEVTTTNGVKTTSVRLNKVTKIVFKVKSKLPNSVWRFKIELQ